MQIAHNVKITSFCNEGDSLEETQVSLLTLLPFSDEELEKEKIIIDEEEATLDFDRKLTIFSVELTKNRHINKVLEHIFSILGEDGKKVLIDTIDSRIDDNANFYFRLDKNLFDTGSCELVDHGNCYNFKINVAAYPAKKKIAKKIILDTLTK